MPQKFHFAWLAASLCYFRALRLGGVLTSPQATPSGLQMTPPSLPGTENSGKHGSPDFILILYMLLRKIFHTCESMMKSNLGMTDKIQISFLVAVCSNVYTGETHISTDTKLQSRRNPLNIVCLLAKMVRFCCQVVSFAGFHLSLSNF